MPQGEFTFDGTGLSTGQKLAAASAMACKPCGCESGSGGGGGSGSGGQFGLGCCTEDASQYTGFCVTISGGSLIDGTYTLTFQTNQEINREITNAFGGDCSITNQVYADGWFSDWVTNCRAGCACNANSAPTNRHRIYMPGDASGITLCAIFVYFETPYCASPPANTACNGTIQISGGMVFGPNMGASMVSKSCNPLVITWEGISADCACDPAAVSIIFGVDAVLTEC